MNHKSFGRHLKLARNKKNMSAKELSRLINIDTKSIWQIESGRRSTTLSNMIKICNALDIGPDYLLAMNINKNLLNLDDTYYELYNKIFDLTLNEFELVKKIIQITIQNRSHYHES